VPFDLKSIKERATSIINPKAKMFRISTIASAAISF
jgi:hypothetical protein